MFRRSVFRPPNSIRFSLRSRSTPTHAPQKAAMKAQRIPENGLGTSRCQLSNSQLIDLGASSVSKFQIVEG